MNNIKVLALRWLGLDGTEEDRVVVLRTAARVLVPFGIYTGVIVGIYEFLRLNSIHLIISPFLLLFVLILVVLVKSQKELIEVNRLGNLARILSWCLLGISGILALLFALIVVRAETPITLDEYIVFMLAIFSMLWITMIIPMTVARILWKKKIKKELPRLFKNIYRVGALIIVLPLLLGIAYWIFLLGSDQNDVGTFMILSFLLMKLSIIALPISLLMFLRSFW